MTTQGPSARKMEDVVTAACRAPSVHNSQPWRWTYDGESLGLFADWDRQLKYGDPDGRDLEISSGAALHHAVIAAAGEGFRVKVQRLPDPNDSKHLASMTFREVDPSPSAAVAHKAIYHRHTDRRTPSSTPVPKKVMKDLVRSGAEHGAFVVPLRTSQDETLIRDLRQLAVLLQHDDDLYLEELSHWTHSRGNDGVPDGSVLAQDVERSRFSSTTRFPAGALRDQPPTDADPVGSWILVATSSDDTLSRLRAGEALSAMLLRATMLDLAVVPYTQAVEVDATRRRLEERVLKGGSCLQLLVRVAVPPPVRPGIPMTRRRPVRDVLTISEGSHVHGT
jgi:hypothetical protein